MEFIKGAPFAGPLTPETAIRDALQIADALSAAYPKGITHRDQKPANILVTASGIKLPDFGRALLSRDQPAATDATQTIGMTQAGTWKSHQSLVCSGMLRFIARVRVSLSLGLCAVGHRELGGIALNDEKDSLGGHHRISGHRFDPLSRRAEHRPDRVPFLAEPLLDQVR
jgi:serine/threonine protein kinase